VLRLRVERTIRQISQSQLAKAAGISQTYLTAIERGRLTPGAATRRRLADLLEVPADELLEEVTVSVTFEAAHV
jgi:transcriptional regulator with XRE-family HTH domain